MQESEQKRSEYRNNIRRRQMEEIMYMNRIRHFESEIRQEQVEIKDKVDTDLKRKEWIYQKVEQMGENPNKNWFQILRELSISTNLFENDYTHWLESGLIKNLLLLLKQEYRSDKLTSLSASILQDIFYYLPENSPQVKHILEYDFAKDLVELCQPSDNSATNYYEAINAILDGREELRDIFINSGIIQAIKNRFVSYEEEKNGDEMEAALNLIKILTKVYPETKIAYLNPKTIAAITPTLNYFISILSKSKKISIILKIFSNLSKLQKEVIFVEIYSCHHLINYILKAITYPNQVDKVVSLKILVCITTTEKFSYIEKLLEAGLVDNLLACLELQNTENSSQTNEKEKEKNNESEKFLILSCLSNVIANSEKDAEYVLHHRIFESLIIPCSQHFSKVLHHLFEETHHMSIYCISSIIYLQNFSLSSFLLENHPLVEILVSSLSHLADQANAGVIVEILSSMQKLIEGYDEVYTGENNLVVSQLETYGILTVLENLESQSKSFQVKKKAAMLSELVNNSS